MISQDRYLPADIKALLGSQQSSIGAGSTWNDAQDAYKGAARNDKSPPARRPGGKRQPGATGRQPVKAMGSGTESAQPPGAVPSPC